MYAGLLVCLLVCLHECMHACLYVCYGKTIGGAGREKLGMMNSRFFLPAILWVFLCDMKMCEMCDDWEFVKCVKFLDVRRW